MLDQLRFLLGLLVKFVTLNVWFHLNDRVLLEIWESSAIQIISLIQLKQIFEQILLSLALLRIRLFHFELCYAIAWIVDIVRISFKRAGFISFQIIHKIRMLWLLGILFRILGAVMPFFQAFFLLMPLYFVDIFILLFIDLFLCLLLLL